MTDDDYTLLADTLIKLAKKCRNRGGINNHVNFRCINIDFTSGRRIDKKYIFEFIKDKIDKLFYLCIGVFWAPNTTFDTYFENDIVVLNRIDPKTNICGTRNKNGHAMNIVGYDDKKKVFIIKNSYGIKWGDFGKFFVNYDVFLKNTCATSVSCLDYYHTKPKNK
jgi:hypothetical protein